MPSQIGFFPFKIHTTPVEDFGKSSGKLSTTKSRLFETIIY